jgi:hypothetical protein
MATLQHLQFIQTATKSVFPSEVKKASGDAATKSFRPNLKMFNSFAANIGKAGRGWFHGNQIVPGSTSAKADSYASKMTEAKEHIKAGRGVQAKLAQQDATGQWKKMGTGERQHAMTMLSDNASDDIGKNRSRAFEFGHGRRVR